MNTVKTAQKAPQRKDKREVLRPYQPNLLKGKLTPKIHDMRAHQRLCQR